MGAHNVLCVAYIATLLIPVGLKRGGSRAGRRLARQGEGGVGGREEGGCMIPPGLALFCATTTQTPRQKSC